MNMDPLNYWASYAVALHENASSANAYIFTEKDVRFLAHVVRH